MFPAELVVYWCFFVCRIHPPPFPSPPPPPPSWPSSSIPSLPPSPPQPGVITPFHYKGRPRVTVAQLKARFPDTPESNIASVLEKMAACLKQEDGKSYCLVEGQELLKVWGRGGGEGSGGGVLCCMNGEGRGAGRGGEGGRPLFAHSTLASTTDKLSG